MTPEEVRAFQRRETVVDGELGPPRDWLGRALRVDGDLGPKTRWAMAISHHDPRRQAIVRRACSKVGQFETRGVANRGPWPDWVLRWCGVDVPEDPTVPLPDFSWCAAHASWCMSVEGLPERKELGALNLARQLRRSTLVLPGDFGWFPTGGGHAHIFPIIGLGPGEVAAAEGNHGNRCALVRRLMNDIEIVTPFPVEEIAMIPPELPLVAVKGASTR